MNTYTQDKLDAFRKFQEENGIFIKYLGEETQLKFTMYDDFLFQALTDYHNHFIDKEHFEANMLDGEKVEDCGGAMLSAKNVWEYLKSLQDTNTKE